MNKKLMISMIKLVLRKLTLKDLQQLQRLVNAGQMTNVFEEALDKSIESKIADEWQQENS